MKNVPARKAKPLPVDRSCSVANTLTILADRWTFLVLREAFFGARHYDEVHLSADGEGIGPVRHHPGPDEVGRQVAGREEGTAVGATP